MACKAAESPPTTKISSSGHITICGTNHNKSASSNTPMPMER